LLHAILQADASLAVTLLTHLCAAITLGHIVRLGGGWRAQSCPPIAEAHLSAVLFLFAFLCVGLRYERTLVGAARPHAWAALHPRLQLAAQAVSLAVHLRGARMTATLGALLLVISTIALLPLLHDLVPAERPVTLLKTVVLAVVHHGVQHRTDVLQTTRRELVVVLSVTGGCRRKHYEVATSAAWSTLNRIVMGGTKIVANLVSES